MFFFIFYDIVIFEGDNFMTLINLTPHDFVLFDSDGNKIRTIPPTFPTPRVTTRVLELDEIDGIPVNSTSFGDTVNLPKYEPGVFYIVSLLVQQANPERPDLYRPDTSPKFVVRDEKGNILGVKALAV